MRLFATLALLSGALALPAAAAVTLKPGNPERKQILDALRVPVRRELKKPVVFKVDHMRSEGAWAFMTGVPQRPGGKKMDYRGTPWAQAIKDGVFDDWICALFRKRNGKWQVVEWTLGATDVAWDGWDREHKAPRSIFPYPP